MAGYARSADSSAGAGSAGRPLYRRCLACDWLLDLADVLALAMGGSATPEQLLDLRLWSLNGHSGGNWLGLVGVDGMGERYELAFNWNTPAEMRYLFYLSEAAS